MIGQVDKDVQDEKILEDNYRTKPVERRNKDGGQCKCSLE